MDDHLSASGPADARLKGVVTPVLVDDVIGKLQIKNPQDKNRKTERAGELSSGCSAFCGLRPHN
jgi:hypothetical protein